MGKASMGSRKRSIAVKKEWDEPDWQLEVVRDTRALWQIVVMAGNTAPYKITRTRRMSADREWRQGYLTLLNVMKDALTSNPEETLRIYFNPDHAGNAERAKNPNLLSELRVDTLSALKFIARCYGTENMPAGMVELLRFKQSNSPQTSGVSVGKKKQSDSAAFAPKKSQDTGNETKASTRLKALLYAAMLWESLKKPHEGNTDAVIELISEKLEEIVKKQGLERIHGFGAHGFKTLTKDLASAYYHTLDPSTKRWDTTHDEPIMGSPSVS